LQDTWLRSQQFQGQEPGQLRALEGVSQWQVYFYRGNAWTNAQSSAGTPTPAVAATPPPPSASAASGVPGNTSAGPALPSGVRLVLEFAEGSGAIGSLIRDTVVGP
jgi:general secretion pathway protein J